MKNKVSGENIQPSAAGQYLLVFKSRMANSPSAVLLVTVLVLHHIFQLGDGGEIKRNTVNFLGDQFFLVTGFIGSIGQTIREGIIWATLKFPQFSKVISEPTCNFLVSDSSMKILGDVCVNFFSPPECLG